MLERARQRGARRHPTVTTSRCGGYMLPCGRSDDADVSAKTMARMRALILEADPEMTEEWKWMGTPVWSHHGIVYTGEAYTKVVKLTFAPGGQDPRPIAPLQFQLGRQHAKGDRHPRRGEGRRHSRKARLMMATVKETRATGETCENCGRSIGRLETPQIYNDHIVCPDCLARLSPQRSAPPPIPFVAQPIPTRSGSRSPVQPDRAKWLWIGGVLLILAGLGSFRGFPDLLAAPFLIIAGALLLPRVGSQVAKKWPSVSRQSTLMRTAACVLAFAMVGFVMPKSPVQSSSPSARANSGPNSPAPAAGPQAVPTPSRVS